MTQPFDLVIRNGLVHDGSGDEPYRADVGLRGGLIAQVGEIAGRGREEIDAAGCIVTPGFIDVHTHYDGQMIWSNTLLPSSCHGVTTVVAGNCGVGFAPCRAEDRELLVSAMEGVEDIPEIVMTEGLTWEWETFPEFLDAIERRPHDIDVAAYIPHSALRIYAIGERGVAREPATEADLATMARLVREAMDAGAMGFATSLMGLHRRSDGGHIPSFAAADAELIALARAVGSGDGGLFQIIPEQHDGADENIHRQIQRLAHISREGGVPVTFTMSQSNRFPDNWRKLLAWVSEANAQPGVELRPQFYPRAVGMVLGHGLSNNPFLLCPSYAPLLDLPLAERVAELRKPELRARLITEAPGDAVLPLALMGRMFDRMFALGDPPNYEPAPDQSMANRAKALGITPQELAYDLLLENDGQAMLYCALVNFADGNLDLMLELAAHPDTVVALGDGGAHYGLICDASYTTFMLTHWARDRQGERMALPAVIKALSADPADLLGLTDRGRIAVGCKADLNVIDAANLRLHAPEVRFDLPAGGRRLHQRANGYRWTIVGGEPISRDGVPTGKLPGKLVRRAQHMTMLRAAE